MKPGHKAGLQFTNPKSATTPITGETTYTLSCLALDGTTLTKSATVKILPSWQVHYRPS